MLHKNKWWIVTLLISPEKEEEKKENLFQEDEYLERVPVFSINESVLFLNGAFASLSLNDLETQGWFAKALNTFQCLLSNVLVFKGREGTELWPKLVLTELHWEDRSQYLIDCDTPCAVHKVHIVTAL